MTLIKRSRVFQKSILGLFALLAAAAPGRSFQIAAELTSAASPPSFGALHVVAKDPQGQVLLAVRVTLRNLAETAERTVASASDGSFLIADLQPGQYQLTAKAKGLATASPYAVEISQNRVTYADVELAKAEPAPALSESSMPDAPAPASGSSLSGEANPAILHELAAMRARIEQLEAELRSRNTPAAAGAPVKPKEETLVASNAAPPTVDTQTPAPPSAQAPAAPAADLQTPFAFGDFTWLNGNPRNKEVAFDTPFFTPEIRFDTHFMTDFNQPRDHTMGGSTESFRSGEVQLEQVSVGGDFHWQNVRGRVLYMNGLFATTTPRNDPSTGVGQWDLRDAYRYFSEAWGGYHFNVNHGLNVDAGIFVSYIGLFSYYNFDNWTYQPSYVSSNTPWFFNGVRIQWFPTNKLKIEPWIINGWQSYARANGHHGFGGQILYRPYEWLSLVFNNYGNGTDTLGNPARVRLHTDDSIEVRYFNDPQSTGVSKMAFSLTGDLGCEYGGGVTCHGGSGGPKQAFLGWMLYNRIWFHKDLLGLTLGGGMMNNPGRYLTLLPPINGADAISGSPYFTESPGDSAKMWDSTVTLQYMPKQYLTWWGEVGYRHSNVPYFSGRGGITPPGGNNGAPADFVCNSGASSGTGSLADAQAACGGAGNVWFPDLRRSQVVVSVGVLVKF